MVDHNRLLFTFEETAELLGFTVPFVKWAAKNGKLLAIGERSHVLISGSSVRQFISRRGGLPFDVEPSGYIYLMRFMQYHKIGLSINVKKRLQGINGFLPTPATLVHTIPTTNMVKAEAQLHSEYAHRRTGGEWFELSTDEIKAICEIKGFWY